MGCIRLKCKFYVLTRLQQVLNMTESLSGSDGFGYRFWCDRYYQSIV